MGNKISFPSDKRIVVVGAGYGGVQLGNKLKGASANFLMIDQRDAMHHNMAAVRAVAIPGEYILKICRDVFLWLVMVRV